MKALTDKPPQELSRSLESRHITMISIGGVIGAGLFVSSSAAIAATGPAIVISYLITGLLVLLVMRMLGEMALTLPKVRSFTEFARAGLGPWGGFVAGWLYGYFWMIVVPVEAIAGANILHGWLAPHEVSPLLLGIVLMAVMTLVNLMSARSYGEFEFWFASIKVAAIIVFIGLAAAFALGLSPHAGGGFANLTANGGFVPRGWTAVLSGAVTVYFALTGPEITTIAAAESREPARAVARMSSTVVLRILAFYAGSILLIVTVVPWVQVKSGESPFTLALTAMQYRWASLAMSAIILTAVLSCLNSAFYVCSRVLFVLAEHGDAPQWLVQLNGRRVPTRSVWMGSLAGVLGVLAATAHSQAVFAFLVNASGALMVFVYTMIVVAHLRVRRAREASGAPAPALTMWLFPWLDYLALAGMAAVLIAMACTPQMQADLRASLLTLLVAIGAFLVVGARRRAQALRSPQPVRP
ncbi:MAG TPA: amino acid permease [Steroidobacteraceae bacterium]|nr:amino acid permease [Steroidobacteraceae bacterium]